MSKDLNIALQNAIGDFGTDVLKSPFLVNILQNYGAFDVHDKESVQKKEILAALIADNHFNTLLQWKKKRNKQWQNDNVIFVEAFASRHHFDSSLVESIEDAFIQAIGLKKQPTPQRQSSKQTCSSRKPRSIVSTINAFVSWIHNQSKIQICRLILYSVTTLNIIQLLAAITRVRTWGVWDWGILFDIIGVLIGILGVCAAILLPAGVACYCMSCIEKSTKINHKKTSTFLILFNAAGICTLYRLSKITFTISEEHYSNYYGSYTTTTEVPMWSWEHLWLFFRPLIFLIAGCASLCLVLFIGHYLLKAMRLGLSFLWKHIHKFFTT